LRSDYRDSIVGVPPSAHPLGIVALRINERWPCRIPSADELMRWMPMSWAVAYRWRATLRAARGQA
jgi:hypothetical protein